jgi:hypothetical protein
VIKSEKVMDLRDSYRFLREELLDRHSPHIAIVISGFVAGLAIPLTCAALVLAILVLGSMARLVAGGPSGPVPGIAADVALLVGGVLLYCGVAGACVAEAWRLGDRLGQHGGTARFGACMLFCYPAGYACWSWLSQDDTSVQDFVVGTGCITALFAMIFYLIWHGHYLDMLDTISPVRWADAAIRMLREDYYDDWVRFNQKMARFKAETQLVRSGHWDQFILLEREERRLLTEEGQEREREIQTLLRPDLARAMRTPNRTKSRGWFGLRRRDRDAKTRGPSTP